MKMFQLIMCNTLRIVQTFVVLYSVWSHTRVCALSKQRVRGCKPDVVTYNLTFRGEWTKDNFPKMYPTHRPQAQWSTLIGRSHNEDYIMWREGGYASAAMRLFAETGSTSMFESEAQGQLGILDAFTAQPAKEGFGVSTTKLFLEGTHSKLSIAVKLIPSPDWYVGVDSLDLCPRGFWRKIVKVRLDPYDAGTDRGLAFTSPNWAMIPAESISLIKGNHSNHEAAAFYYPKLKKLRRLGVLILKRLGTYKRMKKKAKNRSSKLRKQRRLPLRVKNIIKDDISTEDNETIRKNKPSSVKTTLQLIHTKNGSKQRRNHFILNDYPESKQQQQQQQQQRLPQRVVQTTPDLGKMDCEVATWTQWSSCSKTCGFGLRHRTRIVVISAQKGGNLCPILNEEILCGSMRNCGWKYFSFGTWRGIK